MTKERIAQLRGKAGIGTFSDLTECLNEIDRLQAEKERLTAAMYSNERTVGITQQSAGGAGTSSITTGAQRPDAPPELSRSAEEELEEWLGNKIKKMLERNFDEREE